MFYDRKVLEIPVLENARVRVPELPIRYAGLQNNFVE